MGEAGYEWDGTAWARYLQRHSHGCACNSDCTGQVILIHSHGEKEIPCLFVGEDITTKNTLSPHVHGQNAFFELGVGNWEFGRGEDTISLSIVFFQTSTLLTPQASI